MFRRVFLAFLLLAGLAGAGSPALAQGRYAPAPYDANGQSLQRILPSIRNSYPGRFYDAEGPFPDGAGGSHYRIKWMTPDGRIIWLDADARSGRVIGPARNNWRMGPGGGGPPAPPPPYGYPSGGQFRYGAPPVRVVPGYRGGWGGRGQGHGRPHG